MKHTINAEGKKLGRVASEAAVLLMGKNTAAYQRNKIPTVTVTITNCSKAYIDSKKKADKKYIHYTGFRGGLETEGLGDLITRKGAGEAFRRAVYRMLPSNSLRRSMMKNLVITE